MNSDKKLTIEQAYEAVIYFLEKQYELSKSEDIVILLSSMALDTFTDNKPADPAMWQDWLEAVNKIKD